jgi:formylglycine-generating enzyme required for sulfatase activity
MTHSLTKTAAVIVSSTILATLTVNAIDMRGHAITHFLAGLLYGEETSVGPCPDNMVLVDQSLMPFCVDMYEASPNDSCLHSEPDSRDATERNLANPLCAATSQSGAMPWRFVSQTQAELACERAGKRLLSPDEWYKAALGTPDEHVSLTEESCNVAANRAPGVAPTGGGMRCVSDAGAYDTIGNVWEWVGADVLHGVWDERTLPQSGYVHGVDRAGIAFETGTAMDTRFGADRIWTDATLEAAMMRGGYYDSGTNAGLYAVYAASPSTFIGDAVGFRCASKPLGSE